MSNDDLRAAFIAGLALPPDTEVEGLAYSEHPNWDSVGHMALVAEIEDRFDIMLDTDDVLAMSNYQVTAEILRRYGVDV
ncbi:MAG TPA: acyl carrier protein [Solirubrobacteraceae bacterium]|nr:acyl carrier protein [Solirubrobacteraceae bacterium]